MPLFAASQKTLPIMTLVAAGALAPLVLRAEESARPAYGVSTEADLRKYLSEKTFLPDGGEAGKDETYYSNSDLTLENDVFADTTLALDEESEAATGTVEVLATGSKIFGGGHVISSSELELSVKGSGDLFFLNGTVLSVENVAFAGTTDDTKKTGRVFTTGNASGLSSGVVLGAGTTIENRRLVADEYTNYRALGGALVSAQILDTVYLTSSEAGDVVFRGNTAYGAVITYQNSDGEDVSEDLSAFGGAVYASGLVEISGAGTTVFSGNAAYSENSTAGGGAVFISNAALNADGSSSSTSYPDSFKDGDTGSLELGLQIKETRVEFSGNSAQGANAFGGALAVSGGWFDAENAEISFSGNAARNHVPADGESAAEASSVSAGALHVADGGRATFDAGTTVSFSGNSVLGNSALTTGFGGAVVLNDATLSFAGTTVFENNSVSAFAGGSDVYGGALFVTGTRETVTDSETQETTKTQNANVSLSGTVSFSGNTVAALGLSAPESSDDDAAAVESSAQGGALVVNGGKIDGSALGLLTFSGNSAQSKTTAQGGAVYVFAQSASDNVSEIALKTSGEFSFVGNSAELLALDSDEAQTDGAEISAHGGALAVAAGTLDFSSSSGAVLFSGNFADASAQSGAFAQGGAVWQSAGTLALGSATFSGNAARSSSGTAQGGAAYFSGTAQTEFSGAAVFSDNEASAASAQGGAIYASGGAQRFSGATEFSGNEALAEASSGTALARGGAVFSAQGGALEFSGKATFVSNSARAGASSAASSSDGRADAAQGGAVYSAGTLKFASAEFSGNSAAADGASSAVFGGGIYVAAAGVVSAESLTMSGNYVSSNGQARGGAVYAASGGRLDAGDFSLTGNTAIGGSGTVSGGAVSSSGTLRVSGVFSATENSASGAGTVQGGALALSGGSLLISGEGAHEISGNTASSSGGDVFGGAVYAASGFSSTAGTIVFSGNAAIASGSGGNAFGGAIFVRGGNVSLTNATFSGNSAAALGADGEAFGGAIYVDASTSASAVLTFSGNTVISGNASTSGGDSDGIYIGAGTGTEAKGAVTIVFDADADVSTDDDGNAVRENVETASVSDDVVSDGAAFTLRKTGEGDLLLSGDVVFSGRSATLEIEGGNAEISGTVAGTDVDFEKISVASGASLSVETTGTLGGFKSAEIAGTLTVRGAITFSDASTTTLSGGGALALDGASASVSGAAKITGDGTFSAQGATTLNFSGESASLTADALSLGAGTLTLDGAGTLTVVGALTFGESGASIVLGSDATLALTEVAHSAEVENVGIDGSGTLMLYAEAEEGGKIDFSEFYETVEDEDGNKTSELRAGTFVVGENVKIASGISIGEGVSFTLSVGAQTEGSRNILLGGGTLLASGSSADAPLELETFSVAAADSVSVLGAAGENQVFKMVSTTSVDDDGNETVSTASLVLSGKLEITESTTFIGDAEFSGSSSSTVLTGAGTLVGDVSGTGTVSIANIDGDLNVGDGRGMWIDGSVRLSGDANVGSGESTGSGTLLRLNAGASLAAANLNNYGTVSVLGDGAVFSGNFVNAGTLAVAADSTLRFGSGASFRCETGSVIDISAENSAVDFSGVKVSGLDLGVVRVDATRLAPDSSLNIFGLSEDEYLSLKMKIEDADGDYSLEDRFVWNPDTGTLVFLGLNGEEFRGTLYGDLQREGVNRTHEFMRSAQLRGSTRPITPELYGENKLQSPYMRSYLEKRRQRGGEVSARLEARRAEDLALARKLNSPLSNVWVQGDFSYRDQSERHGSEAYEASILGVLAGTSLPLGENWELGGAFYAGTENYKTTSASTRHKVTADVYGLTGYGRYVNEWFDWTLGAAGMHASSDSDRGDFSGDFDSWRLGAMTEFGATLRAKSWLALRWFAGVSAAYSRADSFSESGGDGALSLDSDGAFGVRTNLGLSSAFAVSDRLQFKVQAAWLFDFGNSEYSLDAYMPSTNTSYVIKSRENEESALELGAYLNWTLTENTAIFGGYTGTVRAGERAHSATIGVNYFF